MSLPSSPLMMYNLSNFNNLSWIHNSSNFHSSLHEGGLFSGNSPIGTTLQLFLVQAVLIIAISRILHVGLSKLRQPLVIGEIVGGICLGPSILGLIPGFSDNIFPPKSLPFLTLVANVGLVLYLFLVGLELDPVAVFSNIKQSMAIGLAGIIIPFAAGAAVSLGLYKSLLVPSFNDLYHVAFLSFLLFMGGAFSITAFPVLGRILRSFNMTNTTVGVLTLSASAMTDASVWTLLALIVAIINATNMIGALYMVLVLIGYAVFALVGIRLALLKVYEKVLAKRSNPLSPFVVSVLFMLVFFSSWFTDMLGLNAIFGSFLIGLAVPRKGNLHIKVTEKLEDVVTIFLLPLFFANSGIKTKLNLLNDGWIWLWLIVVVIMAMVSKMVGCSVASRLLGIPWRDSIAVGILMSTRALIELIVLNIGLELRVINDRVFVLMVLMALITTFVTSPLIARFYPPKFYKRTVVDKSTANGNVVEVGMNDQFTGGIRICLYAECIDSLSRLYNIVKLMKNNSSPHLTVLRTTESDESMSSLIGVSMNESDLETTSIDATEIDPVLKMATVLGKVFGLETECFLETTDYSTIGEVLHDLALMEKSNLLLLRWSPDGYINLNIINEIFIAATITTAVLIEPNVSGKYQYDHEGKFNILVPFVGGLNDRKAVSLAISLSSPNGVQVVILKTTKTLKKSASMPKLMSKLSFANLADAIESGNPEELEDEKFIKQVKQQQTNDGKLEVLVTPVPESTGIEQAVVHEYMSNSYNLVIMGKPILVVEKEITISPDASYQTRVGMHKEKENMRVRLLQQQTSEHNHSSVAKGRFTMTLAFHSTVKALE